MFGYTVSWCQHWFEYFPNPPLNVLSMAENVLAHHDKELLQHLVDCGITSQVAAVHGNTQFDEKDGRAFRLQAHSFNTRLCHVKVYTFYCASLYLSQLYVWPLLETLFSEVLTRDEWLRLFDNIFSNHPSFLLMACVAYITCCREPLLLCSQKQDFEVTTFAPLKMKSAP